MSTQTYDIIIIGGGVGGSALAKAVAEAGAQVLVLERELNFRDRVRGEAIMPWGVAEAGALGIRDTIASSGGHELPRVWTEHRKSAPTVSADYSMALGHTSGYKKMGRSGMKPVFNRLRPGGLDAFPCLPLLPMGRSPRDISPGPRQ